jgi:hypothetical protein
MTKIMAVHEIDELSEEQRLNEAVKGKTLDRISYNELGDSYLAIYFEDKSRVVLSTLGGVEIEEI